MTLFKLAISMTVILYYSHTVLSQQAVYDSVVHQQMFLNHQALMKSHTYTRDRLAVILEQLQINGQRAVDTHVLRLEQLKKSNEKLGDPSTLSVNLNVAPGQLYGGKKLSEMRESGVAAGLALKEKKSVNSNCGADVLYGENAAIGAAEETVESAYVNLESLYEKTEADRQLLLLKRESLVSIIHQLKDLSQLMKYQAALQIVDSKLKTLSELEQTAANKVLVATARNNEQRIKAEKLKEDKSGEAMIVTSGAMVDEGISLVKAALQRAMK